MNANDTESFNTKSSPNRLSLGIHPSKYQTNTKISIHIDPRSHLEVSDKFHRYAKNLRLYFQEFAKLNNADVTKISSSFHDQDKWALFEKFFRWLDMLPKPELSVCPRAALDSDVVLYLTSDEARAPYSIHIDEMGRLWKQKVTYTGPSTYITPSSSLSLSSSSYSPTNKIPSTSTFTTNQTLNGKELLVTGDEGWIFVLRGGQLFAHNKQTKSFPRFHHSTFFSGEDVDFAGMLVSCDGYLRKLFPHSGHYRPQEKHLRYLLLLLQSKQVDLNRVQVDAQRVLHVARIINTVGEKVRKVEAAYMMEAESLLHLLEWKYKMKEIGLLDQLNHTIKTSPNSRNVSVNNTPNRIKITHSLKNTPITVQKRSVGLDLVQSVDEDNGITSSTPNTNIRDKTKGSLSETDLVPEKDSNDIIVLQSNHAYLESSSESRARVLESLMRSQSPHLGSIPTHYSYPMLNESLKSENNGDVDKNNDETIDEEDCNLIGAIPHQSSKNPSIKSLSSKIESSESEIKDFSFENQMYINQISSVTNNNSDVIKKKDRVDISESSEDTNSNDSINESPFLGWVNMNLKYPNFLEYSTNYIDSDSILKRGGDISSSIYGLRDPSNITTYRNQNWDNSNTYNEKCNDTEFDQDEDVDGQYFKDCLRLLLADSPSLRVSLSTEVQQQQITNQHNDHQNIRSIFPNIPNVSNVPLGSVRSSPQISPKKFDNKID